MGCNFPQPPQQQAGTPHRLRMQVLGPPAGLGDDFGMQPAPYLAQDQGHADTQQPQDRIAAARSVARWMPLAIGRRNAKPSPGGRPDPAHGARGDAPGGIQQGRALVAAPLPSRVMTDHRQVNLDVALLGAVQGIGGPSALLLGRQGSGPSGPPWCGRLCTTCDRWQDAGPLTRDQIAQHPHPGKATVEPQERNAETQGDQARQQRPDHVIQGLLGAYATACQGRASASDHRVGGGIGEKMGCPTLRFATTDFIVMGLGHRSVVGQCDQLDGNTSPAFAQAVGKQSCQEVIAMACERLDVAEVIGQGAQDRGARGGACKLVAGWMDREVRGRGKHQHPHQVATLDGTWPVQGQGIKGVDGDRVHVLTLQGKMRRRRPRDSPMRLRGLASSSRYRRVPCFLKS